MNNEFVMNHTVSPTVSLLERGSQVLLPQQVNLENVEDFSKVCRMCATITELVIPIFEKEGLQNLLSVKINQHLPIQVTEQDLLPRVVCYQCANTLLAWHELVECCLRADEALRTSLQVKSEHKQNRTQSASVKKDQEKAQELHKPVLMPLGAPPQYPSEEQAQVEPQGCGYCPAQLPTDKYKEHLIAEHSDLLFHCEECDDYLNRKDIINHMSFHAGQFEINRNAHHDPPKMYKKVKKRNKCQKPKQHNETNSETLATVVEIPRDDSEFVVPLDHEIEKDITKDTDTIIKDISTELDLNGKEVTLPIDLNEKTLISNITLEDNIVNEFSDHSDTEYGFGPLPECVFDAIEDSQDSEPMPENTNTTTGGTSISQEHNFIEICIESTTAVNDAFPLENIEKENQKDEGVSNCRKIRTCPICSKKYNAPSSYFYHMKYAHNTEKRYKCKICDAKLRTKSCLIQHEATHNGDFRYECKDCGKKFRSRASLYIHSQIHSGVKNWSCSKCNLLFRWRTHLVRHMKRHDAQKSYSCEICNKKFKVKYDLNRHERTHVAGDFSCRICGVKLAQERYLKAHMEKKHPNSHCTDMDSFSDSKAIS